MFSLYRQASQVQGLVELAVELAQVGYDMYILARIQSFYSSFEKSHKGSAVLVL